MHGGIWRMIKQYLCGCEEWQRQDADGHMTKMCNKGKACEMIKNESNTKSKRQ